MSEHTNLSVADGVDLSFRQMLGAWRIMAAATPAPTALSAPGLGCIFSGVPVPFFNLALVTDAQVSAATLEAHARRACDFAAGQDVPWLFAVTHETLADGIDPAAVLEACGLAPAMPLTGMLAPHVGPARVPEGLDLVVAEDDGLCAAAMDINAAAYVMDLEPAKPFMGRRRFWDPHHIVVGLADGAPVCSAAVMLLEGFRYVLLVATLPGQQRRGFADAAMRRALEHAAAAHGPSPTVLHATAAGRPVYERMGYRTISNHTVFMEQRFLVGH